ncbi:hypothetical protein WAB17_07290 [Parerythrobacter aurantius]|uniref:DUF7668 domain-containing protein n=1 Tax=Parerythrobacter aurantius TaxID=3127706 RepID=UPI003245B4C2
MLSKEEGEHPIPEEWRPKFRAIANAFADDDYRLARHNIQGVRPIDEETASYFEDNVDAYGDELAPLDDATWERSISVWMNGYWDVLVDLTTSNEPVSDLTLHARIYECDGSIEIWSVHVP